MKEIDEFDICPYCGYSQSTPYLPEYLPPRTNLQERYYLGKVKKKNGESVTYIGYDLISDHPVIITEFFPDNIATREKGSLKIVPYTGSETRYKALMLDFIDLAKIMTRSRSLSAIIPVIDVFEENNTVYTVSQYVQTITLREYLLKKGGVLPWESAKSLFAPVISAINTIHTSVNLNHLGISPETILVDKNEQLKISGFSIEALRVAKSDIVPEIYAGYAAPEQYNSANWLGPWTDVYAIAAVIYKVITGTMPPESTSRIVGDNLLPPYKLDKAIPVNISNALFKAMNVSPEKRTQTVEDLILAFSETAEFNNIDDEDEKVPQSNKMNLVWAGIITVSVIIVALLGYFVYNAIFNVPDPDLTISSEPSVESSEPASQESSAQPAKEITVGDYVNKKFTDIQEKDLKIEAQFEFSSSVEKNIVIKQSVDKGKKVKPGTKIVLTVSKGPETIVMPDLVGRTLAFAKTQLENLGLTNIQIVEKETTEREPGVVLETNPSKGIEFKPTESPVIITVSKAPSQTSKPNVSTEPSSPSTPGSSGTSDISSEASRNDPTD